MRPNITMCVAAVIAVVALWCGWRAAEQVCGLDYYAFWQAIECCKDDASGAGVIYGEPGQRRIGMEGKRSLSHKDLLMRQRQATVDNLRMYDERIETWATPFFYASLSPMVTGDYERDFHVFVAVTLLAHLAALVLLCRVLDYSTALTAWCVGLLSLPFLPFRSNISVLNVGSLQLLQLVGVLALLSRQTPGWRQVASGFLLGGSIAVKPTLWPVAVAVNIFLLSDRGRDVGARFMIGCVGGAASAVIVGCFFLGDWMSWYSWLEALKAMLASERPMNPWNCSIPMAMKSITGIDSSGIVLVGLLGGLAALAYRTRVVRSSTVKASDGRADRVVLAGSVGAVVALVASPLTWAHYHLLAVPLLLWVGRRSLETETDTRCPEWYRSLSITAFLLLSVVAQSFGLGRYVNELILANIALILLLALGLHDLASKDRSANGTSASVGRAGRIMRSNRRS